MGDTISDALLWRLSAILLSHVLTLRKESVNYSLQAKIKLSVFIQITSQERFLHLKTVETIKKMVLHEVKIILKSNFSVYKFLLEHSYIHSFTYCLLLVSCYNSRVSEIDTYGL